MKITVNAPAKINLYLNILDKRSDGYHTVEMIMQTVNLFDKITITKGTHSEINITSNHKFPGDIKKNTAYLAAQAFFEHTNTINPSITIHIEKNIPICAGLAGGSSDAAAVLVGLNSLFDRNLSKCDLAFIGKKIGADVPFCLLGGTMLSTGIGTVLSPLTNMPNCYILIVKPNIFVSTKAAYETSDNCKHKKNKTVFPMLSAIKNRNLRDISKLLYNRFEAVMSIGEVDRIKHILNKNGALGSCMSGSGSAVFGIFDNEKSANLCKHILSRFYKEVFLVDPLSNGCYITEKQL